MTIADKMKEAIQNPKAALQEAVKEMRERAIEQREKRKQDQSPSGGQNV